MKRAEAVKRIQDERERQVIEEGYDDSHDNQYKRGELVLASKAYFEVSVDPSKTERPPYWPWDRIYWKPKDKLRNLERSGALLLAEKARRTRFQDFEFTEINRQMELILNMMENIDVPKTV